MRFAIRYSFLTLISRSQYSIASNCSQSLFCSSRSLREIPKAHIQTPSRRSFLSSITTMSQPSLQVKKLTADAKAPTRGSAHAAGYDIYAAEETVIPSKDKGLVSTGLAIAVPEGTYGRIAPRSGLSVKNFIDTGAGVIDADYRGEVKVLLFNFSDKDFKILKGDRIAQLVLEKIYTPEVEVVEQLAESVRGAGGFGSTGTN